MGLLLDQRDRLHALEDERRRWFAAWGIATRTDWTEVIEVARRLDRLDVEITVTERLVDCLRAAIQATAS